MSEQTKPSIALSLLESLAAAKERTTQPAEIIRYNHGGGRMIWEQDNKRDLIADFYDEGNREFHVLAHNSDFASGIEEVRAMREALQEFVDYDVRDHPEWRDCAFCRVDLDDQFSEGHAADCVMTKAKALLGGDGR
jgi:hypothetical protein